MTVTAGGERGEVVLCVVVVRLGRKNSVGGGGIQQGAKRRRFSVEPPERLYVRG